MQSRFARVLIILVLVLAAGYALARVAIGPTPARFAIAQSDPSDAIERGGAWYWIERPPKGKVSLVRNGQVRYSADDIIGFDTDGKRVLIASRDGKRSSVFILSGASFWRGEDSVGRPALSGNQALWAVSHEGSVKSATPLAALGAQSTVFVADADGRGRLLGSLPESQVDMLGTHDGKAYAVSVRKGQALTTALYTVPLTGGLPQRVGGEAGGYNAILRSDGKLFWCSGSWDSGSDGIATAVRSLGRDGKPVTVADWLPPLGRIYESRGETIYLDTSWSTVLWRVKTNDEYPERIGVPAGYSALGIGDTQVLLRKASDNSKTTPLYVMPRP